MTASIHLRVSDGEKENEGGIKKETERTWMKRDGEKKPQIKGKWENGALRMGEMHL